MAFSPPLHTSSPFTTPSSLSTKFLTTFLFAKTFLRAQEKYSSVLDDNGLFLVLNVLYPAEAARLRSAKYLEIIERWLDGDEGDKVKGVKAEVDRMVKEDQGGERMAWEKEVEGAVMAVGMGLMGGISWGGD